MLQELLLTFACLNNTGCTPTFDTYRVYNPLIIQYVEAETNKHLDRIPKVVKNYTLPLVGAFAGGTGNILVNRNLVLSVGRNEIKFIFTVKLD